MTAQRRRPGAGLLLLLVVLTVVSLMLGTIAWQAAAHRRLLARQEDGRQATWLARAGVEIAAGKLLADPKGYDGETAAVLPNGPVKIAVRREKDVYHVTAEAKYGTTGPPAVRTAEARFRRVEEKGAVRLEFVSGSAAEPPSKPRRGEM